MKRYIALLRGINISGKNKIPMAELKKGFETIAYGEVRTYLNSGNVIFSSDEDNIFYKMRPIGGAVRTKKSMII